MHLLSFAVRGLLRSSHSLVWLALAVVMAGCGPSEDAPPASPDAGPTECAPGEMPLESGGCQPAGLPPEAWKPCPPGETPLDGGGCQPAGIPPDGCGQGFEWDGQGGCNAILPPDPCPPGQMAIPGETQCHEVAPCGTGDYGMIPVDAMTEFVNAAYPGTDSDGTLAKPWKKIQDGIDHAESGAIVAVAAGTYVEDPWIHYRPLRLWGRCPALVQVVGAGTWEATLDISPELASHSEIHTLAITGPNGGIATSGPSEVVIDRVWIHDTGSHGIYVGDDYGPTTIRVRASLIEASNKAGVFAVGSGATIEGTVVRAAGRGIELNNHAVQHATLMLRTSLLELNKEAGLLIDGSDATIEATVIRTSQLTGGDRGFGIVVQHDASAQEQATLTLRTSLLEQNHTFGVFVIGSDATIESTVVRSTQPRSDGAVGQGIYVQYDPNTGDRATLALRASLVEQNHDMGIQARSSDATIEATIVRGTQPRNDGGTGWGIHIIEIENAPEHPTLTLRGSLVEHNHDVGVAVQSADATIESTIVRATQPNIDGKWGVGIVIQAAGISPQGVSAAHHRATLALRTSLLEQNHSVGLYVGGSDATIEATVVRATQPQSDGAFGRGIDIESSGTTLEHAAVTLRSSVVEDCYDSGVFLFDSEATLEGVVLRSTQAQSDGMNGDGITVLSANVPAKVSIVGAVVEGNARAGISNFSANVSVLSSIVQCNGVDLDGEASPGGPPFSFEGTKDNLCGCESSDSICAVLTSHLSPPPRIPPINP